jgi:hypothetical protein
VRKALPAVCGLLGLAWALGGQSPMEAGPNPAEMPDPAEMIESVRQVAEVTAILQQKLPDRFDPAEAF